MDLDKAIGQHAKLSVQRGPDGPEQHWHGMIARLELIHAWLGRALYRAVLVPELWRLTLGRYSTVSVDASVPEVLETRLGLVKPGEYELRLCETYEKHTQIAQYKESHYDFISRWLERRGLYFFFEHGDAHEKLVVTDHRGAHGPLCTEPVRYVPSSGKDTMALEALDSFVCVRSALPYKAQFRDYNYGHPTLDVRGKADIVPTDRGDGVDIQGEGIFSPEIATRQASLFAAAELAHRQLHHATGRVFGLRAGYTFTLEEHPFDKLNREYLVIALEHEGTQAADDDVRRMLGIATDEVYRVTVTAIDHAVQYRSRRETPWPRIYGFERAFVDGPADSAYAPVDEEGYYHVQFAFDEQWDQTDFDGSASFPVRMMQPHGGEIEGFHFPLRRGTEVVVSFMGGDPDQPVIAGVVPNALRVSPVTKENHTQNVVQTGGKNRFEMEDLDGRQYIDISTPPKDTRIHLGEPHGEHGAYIVFNTEGNQFVNIGGKRDITVGGALNEHIKGHVTWTHDSGRYDEVTGDVIESYTGPQVTTVTEIRNEDVKGTVTWHHRAARSDTVVGAVTEDYGPQTTTVDGALSYKAGSTQLKFASTKFYGGDTLLDFGNTTIAWHNTKGNIASLNLEIPGGATITTPSTATQRF